nr:uncharacterized protein LOC115260146 [Aedes albopictus]
MKQHKTNFFSVSECGIQFYELVTYSVDDFESSLGQCDVNWNCPKIFEYVNAWRKRNKSTILQALRSDLIADKENQDPNNQETTDSQQLADDGIRQKETDHSEQPPPPVECETESGSPEKQPKVEVETIEPTVPEPVQADSEPKVGAAPIDTAITGQLIVETETPAKPDGNSAAGSETSSHKQKASHSEEEDISDNTCCCLF